MAETVLIRKMSSKRDRWENIKELGSGGQGKVFLARTPERVAARRQALKRLHDGLLGLGGGRVPETLTEDFFLCGRPESVDELGALKEFQIRGDDDQTAKRLEAETKALTKIKHPAVLRILDSSIDERFIVTEFHPNGSFDRQSDRFRSDVLTALKAFRPLVEGVGLIHKTGAIHRDIKPHNIFVSIFGSLVVGDFGIVFFHGTERLTRTEERVGSRYWMAPWVDVEERTDESDVGPQLDIYPLGKLLWLMIAGGKIFSDWLYKSPKNDLELRFPDDPNMKLVNGLLGKCIVRDKMHCLPSVEPFLAEVDEIISKITKVYGYREKGEERWACRMCGKGYYERLVVERDGKWMVRVIGDADRSHRYQFDTFCCDHCHHIEFFYPQA